MALSMKHKVYLTSAIVGLAGGITYILNKSKHRLRNADEIFDYLKIETVQTEESCDKVVFELRRRCTQYSVLGFDCEWVTEKRGKRRPVAFIQLSSYDGYCGLFKLNAMESFPLSLKYLLEDETVIKVGVAPEEDGQKLRQDYSVATKSTLDLRFLAQCCDYEPGGLAALAKTVLGVVMDKSWKVRCSDWEADELTDRQAHYAATDAHVAIKIYAVLLEKLRKKNTWFNWYNNWNPTEFCSKYLNRKYKVKHNTSSKTKTNDKKKSLKETVGKRYPNATRSKPLYHNCYLEAPDGELLCTCNYEKPMWYVERQLADVVSEDPLTVRLRFEPSGRSVGDVGRFYQLQKENRCVVCGTTNSYIRKNVVPREYRKLFPEIMKEHSSHDVVLLCGPCHQLSNIKDQAVREKLAVQCSAPYTKRFKEDATCKKIRSAARALHHYNGKYDIPDARRKELEDVILQYYTDHDIITKELLEEACKLQVSTENSDYESHGVKVVEYFLAQGSNLLLLEELWRQHFLDSMQPKYMPELWSIKHNEERLRVKWNEGRLSPEALKSIGLTTL